jgi:tagatose-1,6-bisphosphate aldolase
LITDDNKSFSFFLSCILLNRQYIYDGTKLSLDERTRLLTALSAMADENPTIVQVCNILEGKDPRNLTPTEAEVREFLRVQVGLQDPTINDLIARLKQAGIVFAITSPRM